MPEYLPTFESKAVTLTASAAVTGGTLVTWAGAPAGAGATAVAGVAGQDANVGDLVTVWYGAIQRLTAAAPITLGTLVKAAAGGQVTPYVVGTDGVDQIVGRATAAAAAGAPVNVRFLA